MRILVDTNLLLRISDPSHPHHSQATSALEALRDQGDEIRTVPQNLYEYWVVATRSLAANGLGLSTQDVVPHLANIKRFFPLLRDERTILEHWERLVSSHDVGGRKAHDARLVAAMQRHGLTHILTFNKDDFTRFPDITVLTPEEVLK